MLVLNIGLSLNATFPSGIFACHNGNVEPHPVNLVKWEDISDDISPDLLIDTAYWNPREALLKDIGQNHNENKIECSIYPNPFCNQTRICLELPAVSSAR